MSYVITIDSGTTNMCALLLDATDGHLIASQYENIGIRDCAVSGNNSCLKEAVGRCIHALLHTAQLLPEDIVAILASGMITSSLGLLEIAHLTAPVGIDELSGGLVTHIFPDICPIPITFIPGVKNYPGVPADMMRGEETEAIALLERFSPPKNTLLILPGSHQKFLLIDSLGKITACLTTMSGELLAALIQNTILSESVNHSFPTGCHKDYVLSGYLAAKESGLSHAAFSAWIIAGINIIKDFYKKL